MRVTGPAGQSCRLSRAAGRDVKVAVCETSMMASWPHLACDVDRPAAGGRMLSRIVAGTHKLG
jgi:hypothetical protein